MFVKTNDRMEVIHALINQWLRDNSVYCNNCDEEYVEGITCCENPQIGTNLSHMQALVIENEIIRDELKYDTGKSEDTGAMRMAFRIPPRLYHFIGNYFKGYNEKFPRDNKELHQLMRKFNKLCTVREI